MTKIAVLVGSLRKDSTNLKLAKALEKLADGKLSFDYVDLDLPLYNEDLWQDPPAAVLALKEKVEVADGVLMITPEYNRMMTPALKNAIDWGTRPWGKNSWDGKPGAAIGGSPGLGALSGVLSLQTLMGVVGVTVMTTPGVFLTFKDDTFAEDGSIGNDATRTFLSGFLDKFAGWVDAHA